LHPSNQKREDVVQKRGIWRENQKEISKAKIYFLDESSINLGMTRLDGWGEKSVRVNDYVPDVRFERTSIIATLSKDGINAPMTFKGTLDQDVFRPYISDFLAPTLNAGDIVVMDNCSVHTVKDILNPIYERGAIVLFLPPYSPDLNPIELAWSKIKSILRSLKARSVDEMLKALIISLNSITKTDILNWFKHDGYCVNV
jgi:transposase